MRRTVYMKKQYDYLLVGSGLFAGVFAYYAKKAGKTCLVLEKREHAGGNIYCENIEGINVHRYGAHIFHTSNREVWNFVNSLVEFNRYTNSPVANYKGEMYNMPFNMNTFSRMWGISTPEEAKKIINEQRKVIVDHVTRPASRQAVYALPSKPAAIPHGILPLSHSSRDIRSVSQLPFVLTAARHSIKRLRCSAPWKLSAKKLPTYSTF